MTRPLLASLAAVLLPVIAVTIATAPGLYTVDSLVQLAQARDHVYFDWNPPIMAGIWSFLIALTGAFSSLFWAQIVLFGGSLMLWAYVFWRIRLWGALAGFVALVWSPFLLNFAGVVWKDVGMACALLAAFGIVAPAHITGRGKAVAAVLSLPFVVYAAGVRYNALPATLPLLFIVFWPSRDMTPLRRISVSTTGALVAAAAIFGIVNWLSYDYLHAARQFPQQFIYLYDLAGLSVRTGNDLIPPAAKAQDFSMERLAQAYKPYSGDYLFADPPVLKAIRNAEEIAKVRRIWLHEIAGHPIIYLTHRWNIFRSLLRIGETHSYFILVDRTMTERQLQQHGETARPFSWSLRFDSVLDQSIRIVDAHTPLFRGWFWALFLATLGIAGPFLTRLSSQKPAAQISLCLSWSGLLYLLPYFFVVPASDFRYLYWCVMSASIAALINFGIAIDLMTSSSFVSRTTDRPAAGGLQIGLARSETEPAQRKGY